MENIIAEILKADRIKSEEARIIGKLYNESNEKIIDFEKRKREEYAKNIEFNVNFIKKLEVIKLENEAEKIRTRLKHELDRLEKVYLDSKDFWIDEITRRVFG